MIHLVMTYIDQYGYFLLFFGLMLELIAVPFPVEFLMSYSGFLVYQGHLNWMGSILLAGAGSSIGVTITYWIGYRLGNPFFEKYGHRILLSPDKLKKTSDWFNKQGNKVLIVTYFIPGVRHITGYFSGITKVSFRTYAMYAYTGAFIWTGTFISLGKALGPHWEQFHGAVKKYLILLGCLLSVIILTLYLFRRYKAQLKEVTMTTTQKAVEIFHTRRRTSLFIITVGICTLGLIMLMAGVIEDFLNNEFHAFDQGVISIVLVLFDTHWTTTMKAFFLAGSGKVLAGFVFLTGLWIVWRGEDKKLEVLFLLLLVCLGKLYEESLRRLFHQLNPSYSGSLLYSFPNEQTFMIIVILGYFVFMLVRHTRRIGIHTFAVFVTLGLLFFIFISYVFFRMQPPSDIASGYVFGGAWLAVNILLLEIFRIIRSV
ncbi:VTT domain-containing protein [Ectobacillus panaciterrae]|uniref:VTT domain-containing protein n=1 Tax=Ectobacillus panaciterrae TaxID=363872 RepID=UPI0004133906|nr:VTT domain-containing protein [Ectobacillus panaciterrae]